MQISEQTRWWVSTAITVFFSLFAIIVAIVIGLRGIDALNNAFKRTESTIESHSSKISSAISQGALTLSLGSEGDRPNWTNLLQDAIDKAVDNHYLKITAENPVTLPSTEELLPLNIQKEIQGVVKENIDIPFEELAAKVVEKIGVRRLAGLATTQRLPVDEMVAIVAGFAQRIRTKE